MRIAQVIHAFPPDNIGGSELYLLNLCRELITRHEVHVFYRIARPDLPEYLVVRDSYEGLPVSKLNRTFREVRSFEQTYRDGMIDREFGRFLDEIQPDIVHVHHLTCLSTTMLMEAKRRDIPVLYTHHDFWWMCHLGQLLRPGSERCEGPSRDGCLTCLLPQLLPYSATYGAMARGYHAAGPLLQRVLSPIKGLAKQAFRRLSSNDGSDGDAFSVEVEKRLHHFREMLGLVDLFISPSEWLRDRFVQWGIPPTRLIQLRNGYPIERFADYRRTPSSGLRFGYIGNLLLSKGVHVLVEAFNGVEANDVELKIYGDFVPYHFFPSYDEHVKGLITNSRIRLMGGYRHQEIARILEGIDVLVVPSIWCENSPLTIQEAFLAGIPVVTSDIGGMAELVQDGVNGLLFKVGDPQDLQRVLRRLIEHRGLVEHLREGIPVVTPMGRHAAELEALYESVRCAKAPRR